MSNHTPTRTIYNREGETLGTAVDQGSALATVQFWNRQNPGLSPRDTARSASEVAA